MKISRIEITKLQLSRTAERKDGVEYCLRFLDENNHIVQTIWTSTKPEVVELK